jgi:hypothetical protein
MQAVFISATRKDLQCPRRHVADLVLRFGHYPVAERGYETQSNDVDLRLGSPATIVTIGAPLVDSVETLRPSSSARREHWSAPAFYRNKRYSETGTPAERREKAELQRQHCVRRRSGRGL